MRTDMRLSIEIEYVNQRTSMGDFSLDISQRKND